MIPVAVRAKLNPLLLILSPPTEGERQNAVAAIERVLTAAGLTWHDMASLMDDTPPPNRPPAAPTPEPRLRERVDGRFENAGSGLVPIVEPIRHHVQCDSWTSGFSPVGRPRRPLEHGPCVGKSGGGADPPIERIPA